MINRWFLAFSIENRCSPVDPIAVVLDSPQVVDDACNVVARRGAVRRGAGAQHWPMRAELEPSLDC